MGTSEHPRRASTATRQRVGVNRVTPASIFLSTDNKTQRTDGAVPIRAAVCAGVLTPFLSPGCAEL